MIHTGHFDARNCGCSPLMRGYMPITSALADSCLRLLTFAAKGGLHHQFAAQFEAPLGSTVESWLPQAKRVPAT
jgi:hypothetical protein